ncbi:Eukaryotic translation initiation factor 3 subunit M [Chytridiales sp. JEL 0842]|nr:Eukaryotic translation initiation factor 3 subunit M [Chytridiales sp. JEL 0842]
MNANPSSNDLYRDLTTTQLDTDTKISRLHYNFYSRSSNNSNQNRLTLNCQTKTLADYVGTLKGEEPGSGAFLKKISDLFDKQQFESIFEAFSLESATLLKADVKEMERAFNLLIALVIQAEPKNLQKYMKSVTEPIVKSAAENGQLKLRILSNLYNSVEVKSPVRYDVFTAIVKVAAANGDMDLLVDTLSQLEGFFKVWGSTVEQKRALYLLLSDKLKATKEYDHEAFDLLLKYLTTFESATSDKSVLEHSTRAIKEAIAIPAVTNFEDLYRLAAIQSLKSTQPKLLDLLHIFLDKTLKDYKSFIKKNPDFVSKAGLDEAKNVKKMRLLSLATLAAAHVDVDVSYSVIAETLEIGEADVELWIIDGIRTGLIDAKMNQLKKTVRINRSTHRVFTDKHWSQLSEKISAWQSNLKEVLTVLDNAKKIAESKEVESLTQGPRR